MTRGDFAKRITMGLGAKVTLHNRRAWASQMQAEGGSAKNNPFNTTMPMPGATNFNSVGVKNYVNAEQGIQATIKTLKEDGHGYEKIRQLLRANGTAVQIVTAIGRSDWGTSSKLALEVLDDIQHDRKPNSLTQLEARIVAS
jgi:hypothetical protein